MNVVPANSILGRVWGLLFFLLGSCYGMFHTQTANEKKLNGEKDRKSDTNKPRSTETKSRSSIPTENVSVKTKSEGKENLLQNGSALASSSSWVVLGLVLFLVVLFCLPS